MAPLVADLQTWVTGGGPTLTVLSLVFLFIVIINLISLCTSCQKQSFELEHEGGGVERSSSTLVKVVQLEDALAGRENVATDKDELDLSTIPEANGEYTSWRNHTTPQPSGLPEDSQVGKKDPAGIAVTNGISANMDGTAFPRYKLHAVPTIAPNNEVKSNVQWAPPAYSLKDWARAHAESTADHTGQVAQEPSNLLQAPGVNSQHDYETISEVLKCANEELSNNSEEPLDVPSYQFVTQFEPDANSLPDFLDFPQSTPPAEVEEIADLEDKHSMAMYARVSKRIKSLTPPPVPPPDDDDEEEEEEEIAPPLPERALDTDDAFP